LTPIGVIGGIRGVLFANVGGAWFDGQPSSTTCGGATGYQFDANNSEICKPVIGFETDAFGFAKQDAAGHVIPIYGRDTLVDGFRLKDGRASYGVGIETFALGFPIHFDWAWRTM